MIMPSQDEPPGKAALRAMQEEVHKPSQDELKEELKWLVIDIRSADATYGGKLTEETINQYLVSYADRINSLTLKQVMGLIGEDEMGDIPEARARNAIRAELRQEAERIWKS